MPEIEIRQITGQAIRDVVVPIWAYAFQTMRTPAEYDAGYQLRATWWDIEHWLALFVDGQAAAIASAKLMSQNVRGKIVSMAGIGGVATQPEYRRQGYSRQLFRRMLADMREQGAVTSVLYPFRESFYERLGYVSFPQRKETYFSPVPLASLLKQDLPGTIKRYTLADGWGIYRDFMTEYQKSTHGMAIPPEAYEHPYQIQEPRWLVVAKSGETVIGIMNYHLASGEMEVDKFYYTSMIGRYRLLQWIAQHIDHAKKVTMRVLPSEHPEQWYPDLEVTCKTVPYAPLGRVVDIEQIAGISCGEGHMDIRVVDSLCPWNEGCFRFASADGKLQVSPIEDADCELTIHAISALIFGTHDPSEFVFRGWGNPTDSQQDSLRVLFPSMLPHLYAEF